MLMTLDDIKTMISNCETRSIEYKQSIAELEKLGKTICGFLNVKGGVGFLGITDKRKIVGIDVTESTKNKLSTFCNHFDPWPDLQIDYLPMQSTNKQIVSIKATPRKDNMPFSYKGTPYLRNEAQLKKMPSEIYKQRLLQTAGFSEAWESMPARSKYTIDLLDQDEIQTTMNLGLEEKRIPGRVYTKNTIDALISLDLLDDNNCLRNAAMALFAKNMSIDYPQCFIRMGRFIDETMDNALDSRQISGNAFQLLSEAEIFVKKHLPISSRYNPNQLERVDELALPFLAIREAIVNALVHRDYSDRAGDIALFIFNTHLEIHNAGHLYGDMTIPKLKQRHTSRRRNPMIAQVFYARKLIDRYGSGTLRMIDLCEQQGLQPPEFSEAGDGFLVKFYFKEPIGPTKQIMQHNRDHGFSNREKELLDILAAHRKLTFKEIVSHINKPPSDRTIRNELSNLRNQGLVSSEGHGRGAAWFIKDNKAK